MDISMHMADIASALAAAVISGAIAVLTALLQSKIKSERINADLGRLAEICSATAHELQHEFVDGWKKSGGGKLSKPQVESLKSMALARCKERLDDPAIQLLRGCGADFEGLILSMTERAVSEIRNV